MAQPKNVNWFAIWVTAISVVVVIAIGGFVWFLNSTLSGPGEVPASEHVNAETGAISFGDGDQTLDTYIDFMCPICNQFEQVYGDQMTQLREDGTITLNVHPIAILNRVSNGTNFSTRAANAMYAVTVADYDRAHDFMQAMFANQPAEMSSGLTDEEILGVAEAVGITVTDELRADVEEQRYASFVNYMTARTPLQPGQDKIGTPTLAVNGEVLAGSQIPNDLATLFR